LGPILELIDGPWSASQNIQLHVVQDQRHKLQESASRSREGLQKYIAAGSIQSAYVAVYKKGKGTRQEKGRSQGQILRKERRNLTWAIDKTRKCSDDTRTDGHNQK
jgi:hypothetical protein